MQKKMNIQMPFSFLMELYVLISRLVDYDYDLDPDIAARCKSLESQVVAKVNAMVRRETFSKYKVAAPGSEEREKFRHEYLNLAGIYDDWISDTEIF